MIRSIEEGEAYWLDKRARKAAECAAPRGALEGTPAAHDVALRGAQARGADPNATGWWRRRPGASLLPREQKRASKEAS